jgi:hypothetical protein
MSAKSDSVPFPTSLFATSLIAIQTCVGCYMFDIKFSAKVRTVKSRTISLPRPIVNVIPCPTRSEVVKSVTYAAE